MEEGPPVMATQLVARNTVTGEGPADRRRRLKAAGYFLGFAAPGLLAYACFVMAPIVLTIGYSFTKVSVFQPDPTFVGLRNYRDMFSGEAFPNALKVTLILSTMVVVIPNVLGLGIALLLDGESWFYRALRGVFFVPVVLSSVVVSVIWTRMLGDDGVVNSALRSLGVRHPPGWLSDPDLAVYSVGTTMAWQMLGFCVVVYLAGLQGIPHELHEAAAIDGAGPVRRFTSVTWPMLAPAVTINTVMLMIEGFKSFDHVKVITNGGPGDGTTASLAFSVVNTGFTENRTGAASAMAIVMLLIVAIASVVVLRLLQRREVAM
jgi:multiple sugar transport system permease protein